MAETLKSFLQTLWRERTRPSELFYECRNRMVFDLPELIERAFTDAHTVNKTVVAMILVFDNLDITQSWFEFAAKVGNSFEAWSAFAPMSTLFAIPPFAEPPSDAEVPSARRRSAPRIAGNGHTCPAARTRSPGIAKTISVVRIDPSLLGHRPTGIVSAATTVL